MSISSASELELSLISFAGEKKEKIARGVGGGANYLREYYFKYFCQRGKIIFGEAID